MEQQVIFSDVLPFLTRKIHHPHIGHSDLRNVHSGRTSPAYPSQQIRSRCIEKGCELTIEGTDKTMNKNYPEDINE